MDPAPGSDEPDSTTVYQQWPQEAHAFTEREMRGKMSAISSMNIEYPSNQHQIMIIDFSTIFY